jgi:hypothetical protein
MKLLLGDRKKESAQLVPLFLDFLRQGYQMITQEEVSTLIEGKKRPTISWKKILLESDGKITIEPLQHLAYNYAQVMLDHLENDPVVVRNTFDPAIPEEKYHKKQRRF